MGTDRKGPLAAFVVIAIIAAILLVTSVRSQAAPGWLDPDNLPASVVAAPPLSEPREWVTTEVDRVVEKGVVLLRKSTSDPVREEDPTTSLSDSVTDTSGRAPADATALTHAVAHSATHHPTVVHHAVAAAATTTTTSLGHGRHLGWHHAHVAGHAHDHGRHLGWTGRH